MNLPDLDRARDYALERLERELPATLTYHSLSHTRDYVVPDAERLANLEGVSGEELMLVITGALYHDIGFAEQRVEHEARSARIAAEVLPRFGYSAEQVSIVEGIIMATRIPQRPRSLSEAIVADADLDLLGRDDFWTLNRCLRAELKAVGQTWSDEEWYSSQLAFLREHRYFTITARATRQAGKERHIQEVEDLLRRCRLGPAGARPSK
jgi:uncharacterized protein